ncbi:hypothetical protein HDV02_006000 [Globomyces sp. JEL0801]|nr:hypothetical protein HDV02_006000 [Globomyces sp. JEL0801]
MSADSSGRIDSKNKDSNDLVAQVAQSTYRRRPTTLWSTIKDIYTPKYSYSDAKLSPYERLLTKRYFNGRMKTWEFILLHFFVIFNVITILVSPIAYFDIINKIGTPGSPPILLRNFNVGAFSNDSLNIGIDFALEPILPFPIQGGIGATKVHVYNSLEKEIASMDIPSLNFWINNEINVKMDLEIKIDRQHQDNIQDMIQKLSTKGIEDFKIIIRFNAPINGFGIPFYSGLPLYKNLSFGDFSTSLSSVGKTASQLSSLLSPDSFKTTGAALKSKFSIEDIATLTQRFAIAWTKLDVKMNDEGIIAGLSISFENGLPVTVTKIEGLDIYIALEEFKICRIILDSVKLSEGLQQLDITTSILFIDPLIDTGNIASGIEKASLNFANNNNFKISVTGPIQIKDADFVQFVTKHLDFVITLQDILSLFGKLAQLEIFSNKNIKDFLTLQNFESLLGESDFEMKVLSKQIDLFLNLIIPKIIAIPKQIIFPYYTSLSIYGQSAKVLQSNVLPVSIFRTDRSINSNITVMTFPENSEMAATELANSINPILAADPKIGVIGFKDFFFYKDELLTPFNWCRQLFGKRIINFSLPKIKKDDLIQYLLTSKEFDGLLASIKKRIQIGKFSIAQLNDEPGFGVDGLVSIHYPTGVPRFGIDFGYFTIDTTIDLVKTIQIELPNGLKFIPSINDTTLNAKTIIGRNELIAPRAQTFVDSILNNRDVESSIGITGMKFGVSSTINIITFSKILFDLSTKDIKSILSKVEFQKAIDTIDIRNAIQLNSIDLDVKTSTNVLLAIGTVIKNPFNIDLQLGTIRLDVLIDSNTLLSLDISPIVLKHNENVLDLKIGVVLLKNAGDMNSKISQLFNYFLSVSGTDLSKMIGGIGGLTLIPLNAKNSNSHINQFAPVKVQTSVNSLLTSVATIQDSKLNPINFERLLPKSDFFKSIDPKVLYGAVIAKTESRLNVGTDISYSNPLPISANVPFVSAAILIDEIQILNVEIVGIRLNRSSGIIKPRIDVHFENNPNAPLAISNLVSNFFSGSTNQKISLTKIGFGTSATDQNDILNLISVNVTPFLKPLEKIGIQLKDQLGSISVSSLSKRSNLFSLQIWNNFGLIVNGLGLNFLPNKVIQTDIGVSLTLPFPVDFKIPFVSIKVELDEVSFVEVGLGLDISGTNPTFNLPVKVNIDDTDVLADRVALVINNVLATTVMSNKVRLNQLLIGVSANDHIKSFSDVLLTIPAQTLVDQITVLAGQTSLAGLSPILGSVGITAIPSRSILLKSDIQFDNQFPVSITGLDYVSLLTGIDEIDILTVQLPGLSLKSGSNKLNTTINVGFPSDNRIQDKVASFATHLVDGIGSTTEKVGISGLRFGKPDSPFNFLSKSRISVASSTIINAKSIDLLKSKLDLSMPTMMESIKLGLLKVDIKEESIDASIKGSTKLPLPFSVAIDIPIFKLGTNINRVAAFDVDIRKINLRNIGEMNIDSSIHVQDTDELANNIAAIAESVISKTVLPGTIGGGRIQFGVDGNELIDTFAKVDVFLNLEKLLRPIISSLPTVDVESLINMGKTSLGDITVKALPSKSIGISTGLTFNNDFPITLSGLDYVTLNAGIDEINVLNVNINGLSLTSGNNSLSAKLQAGFPSDVTIQKKVALFGTHLVDSFGKTTEKLGINGLKFGKVSKPFKFLSKARIQTLSSSILNANVVDRISSIIKFNIDDFSKALKLNQADIELLKTKSIKADVKGAIDVVLPVKIHLDIPYFEIGTSIDQIPAFDVVVSNINVMNVGPVNLSTTIHVQDTEDLSTEVSDIVNAVVYGLSLPGTVGGKRIYFGIDTDDRIDTFAELDINLNLEVIGRSVINYATSIDPSSLLQSLSPGLNHISVIAQPKKRLSTSINFSFKNSFNVSLSGLGYFEAECGINGVEIVSVASTGVALNTGANVRDLALNLDFASDNTAQVTIGEFGLDLTNYFGKTTQILTLSGLLFGYDKQSSFQFLRRSALGISSSKIFNRQNLETLILQSGLSTITTSTIFNYLKINEIEADIQESNAIMAKILGTLKVPFNITLDMPYFGSNLVIDDVPFVGVDVSGIKVGQQTSQLVLNSEVLFSDSEDAMDNVAEIAHSLLNSKNTTSKVGISNPSFGFDKTSANVIDTFSKLHLQTDFNDILTFIRKELNNVTLPSPIDAVEKIKLNLTGLDISCLPQKSLSAKLQGSFVSPSPISFSLKGLGHFGLNLGIDKILLMAIDGTGLAIKPDNNILDLMTVVRFGTGDTIQDKMASLVNNIFKNGVQSLTELISVSEFSFGFSKEKTIRIFSKIFIDVPIKFAFNQDVIQYVLKKLGLPNGLSVLNPSSFTNFVLFKNLSAEFLPTNEIQTYLSANVNNPININLNIPYFGTDVSLNYDPLINLDVSGVQLIGKQSNLFNVKTIVALYDNEKTAENFKFVVSSLLNSNTLEGSTGVTRVMFGLDKSEENVIDTFSRIRYDVLLQTVVGYITAEATANITWTSILAKFQELIKPDISLVTVKALEEKTLSATILGDFETPINLSLKGLGFFEVFLGIEKAPIIKVGGSGISIMPNKNVLDLKTILQFESTESALTTVESLSDNVFKFGIHSIQERITISSIKFGYSREKHLNLLGKILIDPKISSLITPEIVDYFWKLLGLPSTITGSETEKIQQYIKFKQLTSAILPSNDIRAVLDATVDLPFHFNLDMPHFGTTLTINSDSLLDVQVSGTKVIGNSSNDLTLVTLVHFYDDEKSANNVAGLANAVINGNQISGTVGVNTILFGIDNNPKNVIDTFSRMNLNVKSQSMIDIIMTQLRNITVPSTINAIKALDLHLDDITVNALVKRNVLAKINGGFITPYKIGLTGLGYFEVNLGLDDVSLFKVLGEGLEIKPDKNDLNLRTLIEFPSSEKSQDKVALFANNLIDFGLGNTKEKVSINSIKFGHDSKNPLQFLSKTLITLSSSLLFNADIVRYVMKELKLDSLFVGGVNSALAKLQVNKFNIDGSPIDRIATDIEVMVKDINFGVAFDIGYAGVSLQLNRNNLLNAKVVSGVKVNTTKSGLDLNLKTDVTFTEDNSIRLKLNDIANSFFDGSTPNDKIGISNLIFGSSDASADLIDLFSKINVAYTIPVILDLVKSTSDKPLIKFSPKSFDFDVFNENTLLIGVSIGIDLPIKLNLNMPYVNAKALYNNQDFVDFTMKDLKISNNLLEATSYIKFSDNRKALNSLVAISGNIAFHRKQTVTDSLTVKDIVFGSSSSNNIKILSTISIGRPLTNSINTIGNFVDTNFPMEILDVQAVMGVPSIAVDVVFTTPSFKTNIMLSAMKLQVAYQLQGEGDYYQAIDLVIDPIKLPYMSLMATPNIAPNGFARPLGEVLTKIFTFEDFAKNSRIGFITLVGSKGDQMSLFDKAVINSPPVVFPAPLEIDVLTNWPFSKDGLELPVKFAVSLANTSPIHLDVGQLVIALEEPSGDSLLTIRSEKNIVIRNINEGGGVNSNAGPPSIGVFDVVIPWSDFNPVKLAQLSIRLIKGEKVKLGIHLKRNKVDLPWVKPVMDQLVAEGFVKQLIPLIGVILANLKFKLFGIDIEKIPIIGDVVRLAEKWITEYISKKNGTPILSIAGH